MKKIVTTFLFIILPTFGLTDYIDLSEHLNRVDIIVMSPNGHLVAFNSVDSRIFILKGNQLVSQFSTDRFMSPSNKSAPKTKNPLPIGFTVAPDVEQTGVKANHKRLVLAAGEDRIFATWYNDTFIYVLDYTGNIIRKMEIKFPVRALTYSGEELYVFNGRYSPANNKFCEIKNLANNKSRFIKLSPTKIIKPFPKKIMDFKKKVFVKANLSGGTTVYKDQVFFSPSMTQNTTRFKNKKVISEWIFPFKYVNHFDYTRTDYAPDININRTWTNWSSRNIEYGAKNYVIQILATDKILYGVYQINDKENSYANLLFCFNYEDNKLVWHKEFDGSRIFLLKADPNTVVFYNSRLKRVEILKP